MYFLISGNLCAKRNVEDFTDDFRECPPNKRNVKFDNKVPYCYNNVIKKYTESKFNNR